MEHKVTYSFILSVLLVICSLGCSSDFSDDKPISKEQEESVEVRPEVIFTIADDEPIYKYVESQGVVEANREVQLKPKISGFVEQSNIVEGRWVQKGDTLLAFEKQEWQLAVQEARNEYEKARSAYRIENRLRSPLDESLRTNGDSTRKSEQMVRIATGLAKAEVALNRAKLNHSYASLQPLFPALWPRSAVLRRANIFPPVVSWGSWSAT